MERMLARVSHPPLPGRVGARRARHHRAVHVDQHVHGVAQIRGDGRARAGRSPRRGPVRPLDLVAIMIDGVHFADHLCMVALGIDIDGTKHSVALVKGSTENTTLVRSLLVRLRERGLDSPSRSSPSWTTPRRWRRR